VLVALPFTVLSACLLIVMAAEPSLYFSKAVWFDELGLSSAALDAVEIWAGAAEIQKLKGKNLLFNQKQPLGGVRRPFVLDSRKSPDEDSFVDDNTFVGQGSFCLM